MGFSNQEYWSGLPFTPPGDLPDPEIDTASPMAPDLQADSYKISHQESSSLTFVISKREVRAALSFW